MAAKGIRECVLNPALRQQGLSVRKARVAINIVFGSIQDALARHEQVDLPIGSFTVLRNAKQRAWRFGKLVIFDKYRIEFLPSDELNLAAVAAPPSGVRLGTSSVHAGGRIPLRHSDRRLIQAMRSRIRSKTERVKSHADGSSIPRRLLLFVRH
jgi:nucleoid DNA-binding protein